MRKQRGLHRHYTGVGVSVTTGMAGKDLNLKMKLFISFDNAQHGGRVGSSHSTAGVTKTQRGEPIRLRSAQGGRKDSFYGVE